MRRALPIALLWVACNGSPAAVTHDAGSAGKGSAGDPATLDPSCTYDPRIAPPASCPNDVPSSCSDPAPSYGSTVSAIIGEKCRPCHQAGGKAPDKPFDTYTQVYAARATMLNRVSHCVMPPACAPQPSASQRHDLLQWLVCSAPNN